MHISLIAFISDFGLEDAYVGVVKGVIAGISPNAKVIDLTHDIPAGDIRRAAVTLWQAAPYFPSGTIYLGVIDPGVGTQRKAIICRSPDGLFVGPDNGLVSYLWQRDEVKAWEIIHNLHSINPSNTFHGRDLFGPVAAHIANGVTCASLGTPIPEIVYLEPPKLRIANGEIWGEVLFNDHFGNIITSIGRLAKQPQSGKWTLVGWGLDSILAEVDLTNAEIIIGRKAQAHFVNTFAEVSAGSICALVGSSGLIEIVSNRVSAASIIRIKVGEEVLLKLT